jgi:hypothetical protein
MSEPAAHMVPDDLAHAATGRLYHPGKPCHMLYTLTNENWRTWYVFIGMTNNLLNSDLQMFLGFWLKFSFDYIFWKKYFDVKSRVETKMHFSIFAKMRKFQQKWGNFCKISWNFICEYFSFLRKWEWEN